MRTNRHPLARWLAVLLVAYPFIGVHYARGEESTGWERFPDGTVGKMTEYKGVKDTSIAAYIRKPNGDGPFPVVVMIHGGGQSQQGTYALGRMVAAPTADFLTAGWAVYAIDFRPQSSFQAVEWEDACLAVETVKKLPFIDGQRVALIGGSHGGYNTARVASRCNLSCAISCAPAAIDLIEVFKARQSGIKLSPNLEHVLTRAEQAYGVSMADVAKDPARFQYESALTEAEKVRCPILLISGRNDTSSPPSVIEAYAIKLKEAGKKVELYLPDNGPHGFYFGNPRIPETEEATRRAVAFIRGHFGLPPKPAPTPSQPSPGSPTRETPSSRASDARAEQLLRRLDTNGDGEIAGDEAKSTPGQRFLRMFDADNDGVVTREEIGERNTAEPRSRPAATKGSPPDVRRENQRADSASTESKTFHSAALQDEVSYALYLPPSYASEPQWRYPVVFWLHGGGGGPADCWKFVETIDGPIKAGKCPEMLVVGVDGRSRGPQQLGSQYSDWKDGSLPMETVIIKELLPHIDQTYHTLGTREGRALEGFSMGGHGALHLAFRHPDLFGAVTAIGPALIVPGDGGSRVQEVYENGAYKGDEAYWRQHDPLTLAERNPEALRGKMFIRLITGDVEGNFTHRRTVELSQKLKTLGIEHEFIRPGETGHNYVKIYEAMPEGYEFYTNAFAGLKPPVPPKPHQSARMRPESGVAQAGPPRWVDSDETEPPVCYDITKTHPGEIGQYRVSRSAHPVEPFEIMDGLYYVGNTQVSAHLLKTDNGLILLDSTMPHEVPWLLASIRKLGFQPSDVRVVIGSHAHVDHIGGHWYFQNHFGARTWMSAEEAPAAQSGIWQPGMVVELDGTIDTLSRAFPSFKTDRVLQDGETAEWGGRELTFHRAPGHTAGTLMIVFAIRGMDGKIYQAGILGGLAPGRPEFTATCRRLRKMDIEVWLGAHPNQNRTLEKAGQLNADTSQNPFIDPQGWKDALAKMSARDRSEATGVSLRPVHTSFGGMAGEHKTLVPTLHALLDAEPHRQ